MPTHPRCLVLTTLLLLGACAAPQRGSSAAPSTLDVQRLPMYWGTDGRPCHWDALIDAVADVDVVIVGEQHDDAVGHAVQTAIVRDVVARWPATTLTLEMIERDEQILLDDYREEIIDAGQLEKLTRSQGWGEWAAWYQPSIDAVIDGGGHVAGANAPRRYVRLARTDGYDRLRALDGSRQAFFAIPDGAVPEAYWARFQDIMTSMDGHALTEEQLDAAFRSQLVWDATMSETIDHALDDGADKVVHFVGQFHSDFEGGTVVGLKTRRPGVRVLTISLRTTGSAMLLDDDRDRADIVIYTGS